MAEIEITEESLDSIVRLQLEDHLRMTYDSRLWDVGDDRDYLRECLKRVYKYFGGNPRRIEEEMSKSTAPDEILVNFPSNKMLAPNVIVSSWDADNFNGPLVKYKRVDEDESQ